MLSWVTDLLIPAFTTGLGVFFKKRPPKYRKTRLRTKRAQLSRETWEYTNRRLGELWFRIGLILIIVVILHRLFSTLDSFYVSALNIAAGIACFVAAIPIVETELKDKFTAEGNWKSSDTDR